MQGCGRARGRAVNKQQPKPTTQEHAAPRASATPIGRGFQAAPVRKWKKIKQKYRLYIEPFSYLDSNAIGLGSVGT